MENTNDNDDAKPSHGRPPAPATVAGGWGGLNLAPNLDFQRAGSPAAGDGNAEDTVVGDDDAREESFADEEAPHPQSSSPATPFSVSKPVDDSDECDGDVVSGGDGGITSSSFMERPPLMQRLENRIPRSYNIFFKVLLPVFLIIPVAILCGFILAQLEAPAERASNNAASAEFLTNYNEVQKLAFTIERKKRECVDAYFGDANGEAGNEIVTINVTEYRSHVQSCDDSFRDETIEIQNNLNAFFIESLAGSVTFNWNTCVAPEGTPGIEWSTRLEAHQRSLFVWTWFYNFLELWGEYHAEDGDETGEPKPPTFEEYIARPDLEFDSSTPSAVRANADADGGYYCKTNVAGGSVFWWTIMTTVGYGTTSPTTRGGRALVYTLGFVTILIFTVIIGQAGYVMLAIFDDFFLRFRRMKRLAGGWTAVIFWLAMLVLWLLVVAGIVIARNRAKYDEDLGLRLSLADAFWFAFITGTTVGLGDIYIRHDKVTIADMFYIPLVILGAFVLLSNFLYKLSNVLKPYFEEGEELHAILEKNREELAKEEN